MGMLRSKGLLSLRSGSVRLESGLGLGLLFRRMSCIRLNLFGLLGSLLGFVNLLGNNAGKC